MFPIASVLLFAQSGSIPAAYDQPYRPQYHFSPRENWTNDPNGLVYFEGEYHLFFQYNPAGDQWGHMTWGHAVSPDMLHWNQLPPAIPEENGVMIFTGSTVIDERNTSGFCANGKPCMVAIYTGYTAETKEHPSLQTQNIAYSNDRGRHWTKYSNNPVLNLNMTDFRDPKVFWSKQSARWVMLVSLPNDHKIRVYGSKDLKQWSPLDDFGPAGATAGQWECPELFELPVEGASGETRWVLKVGLNPGSLQGGSGEQYFIGRFDGTRFSNENPPSQTMWTDYGKDCYCALTFNNLPRAQRAVMLGWMDNWQYAKDLPTSPWRGQMTFPRRLSLRKTSEGLRLVQAPVEQISELGQQPGAGTSGTLAAMNHWLAASPVTKERAFEFKTEVALGTAQEVGWRILNGDGHYTVIGYDRQAKKLFFDRTHTTKTNISADYAARTDAPLALDKPVLRLTVLVDRDSVEVFADDGKVTTTNLVFPPVGAGGIEIYAKGGEPGQVSAHLTSIRSIWSGK